MPSNYRVLILGGIALACGAGFAILGNGWIAWTLAMAAVGCLVGFVILTIARVQRTDETPEQAAQRREDTEGQFDPDP